MNSERKESIYRWCMWVEKTTGTCNHKNTISLHTDSPQLFVCCHSIKELNVGLIMQWIYPAMRHSAPVDLSKTCCQSKASLNEASAIMGWLQIQVNIFPSCTCRSLRSLWLSVLGCLILRQQIKTPRAKLGPSDSWCCQNAAKASWLQQNASIWSWWYPSRWPPTLNPNDGMMTSITLSIQVLDYSSLEFATVSVFTSTRTCTWDDAWLPHDAFFDRLRWTWTSPSFIVASRESLGMNSLHYCNTSFMMHLHTNNRLRWDFVDHWHEPLHIRAFLPFRTVSYSNTVFRTRHHRTQKAFLWGDARVEESLGVIVPSWWRPRWLLLFKALALEFKSSHKTLPLWFEDLKDGGDVKVWMKLDLKQSGERNWICIFFHPWRQEITKPLIFEFWFLLGIRCVELFFS